MPSLEAQHGGSRTEASIAADLTCEFRCFRQYLVSAASAGLTVRTGKDTLYPQGGPYFLANNGTIAFDVEDEAGNQIDPGGLQPGRIWILGLGEVGGVRKWTYIERSLTEVSSGLPSRTSWFFGDTIGAGKTRVQQWNQRDGGWTTENNLTTNHGQGGAFAIGATGYILGDNAAGTTMDSYNNGTSTSEPAGTGGADFEVGNCVGDDSGTNDNGYRFGGLSTPLEAAVYSVSGNAWTILDVLQDPPGATSGWKYFAAERVDGNAFLMHPSTNASADATSTANLRYTIQGTVSQAFATVSPIARNRCSSFVSGTRIYVCGGQIPGGNTAEVAYYDGITDTFTWVAGLSDIGLPSGAAQNRVGAGGLFADGLGVVGLGANGAASQTGALTYIPSTDVWSYDAADLSAGVQRLVNASSLALPPS